MEPRNQLNNPQKNRDGKDRDNRPPRDHPPRSRGDDRSKERKPDDRGPKDQHASPAPPSVPGLEPRRAALDILNLVAKGRTLDDALTFCRSFDELEGPDRGLARLIATTTLRQRGAIDDALGHFIDRPLPKRATRATDILRLTAAQTIFLKTPDHAAVSIAVALAQSFQETQGYAGLVNAVARKVAAKAGSTTNKLSPRINTPGWLWRAWERGYGPGITRKIATAHQTEPTLDLTIKDQAKIDEIATEINGEKLVTGSIRLAGQSSITKIPGFYEGKWWVQDAAASLPVQLLGDVSGKTVTDLCAAPGGKTMQLAARGAIVTGIDQAGPRLKIIRENMERTGLFATLEKSDALDWAPEEKVDAVLLDAPCTATGTIRRHPDILWSKTEDDVKALTTLQAKMIDQAITLLKPGGTLVYCVCSLQPEEGERQAAAALKRHPSLTRQPISANEIGGFSEAINRDGDLRTLPFMLNGMDGFFAFRGKIS